MENALNGHAPPPIVELVGPAGAGKSELAEALCRRGSAIASRYSVWRLPRRRLARSTLRMLPALARHAVTDKRYETTAAKHLIRLETLYRILEDRTNGGDPARIVLLDEGIIFALAQIRYEHGAFPFWLDERGDHQLRRWSDLVRTVIRLDAPDGILVARIRERQKAHRMKSQPDTEIARFLAGYRRALNETLDRFQRFGPAETLEFDTSCSTADEIATTIVEKVVRPVETKQ